MERFVEATAFLLVLLLVAAEAPAGEARSLQVTLKNERDGSPIRGVRVQAGETTAVTDHLGIARLTMPDQSPGSIVVGDLDYLFLQQEIAPGDHAEPLTLTLKPMEYGDVAMSVSVAGSKEPLAGAQVELTRTTKDYAPVSVTAWSGFDGALAVRGLPVGEYGLRVTAAGCQDYAGTVSVRTTPSTLELPLQPVIVPAAVTGSVADALTGDPIAGAELSAVHTSQGEAIGALAATQSQADGSFQLAGIPTGLRRGSSAQPRPLARRFLIRARLAGYSDGYFPVEPGGRQQGPVQALLWPLQEMAEREPNNTIETAQPIPAAVRLQLAIAEPGDRDFFRLALPTDGLLRVRVPAVPIPLHFVLHDLLRDVQPPWRNAEANKPQDWELGLRAGSYALQVEHYGNAATTPNPFVLSIEFLPVCDVYEPNDSASTAATVSPGERLDGFLFPVGDLDFFRFVVNASGTGLLTMPALPIATHTRVLNVSSRELAWRDGAAGAANPLEFALPGPDTYYAQAELYGRTGQTLTPYEADLETVPSDLNERGWRNETLDDATNLEVNTYACGTLNPIGDRDWFRVALPESGTLQVHVSALPIPTYLQVTDAAGHQLGWRQANAGQANDLVVGMAKGGAYGIGIEHYGRTAWSASPYLLRTSFYRNDGRDRHDNGEMARATPISVATVVEGQIGFAGDRDFYRIFMPMRGVLRPEIDACPLPLFAEVLAPGGRSLLWRQSPAGQPLTLDAQITVPGWQTVHLENVGNHDWARAVYRLRETISPEDPYENNDQVSSATALPARTALSATLLPVGDCDFYRFYAARKGKYRAVVTALDIPMHARVRDDRGKEVLWGNAGAKEDLNLAWEAPSPGQYWISLENMGRAAWSEQHYSIHAEEAQESPPPIARLEARQTGGSRRAVTFAASAKADEPIRQFEIDFDGDGIFDWPSERPGTVEHTYERAGWVTAALRVTGASGAVGYDYAMFTTRDLRDDGGLQIDFIKPSPGQIVDSEFEVSVLAWDPDGGPVPRLHLEADGQEAARWLAEPYETRLKPDSWAGRGIVLAAVAESDPPVRAELPLKVSPLINLQPPADALLTSPQAAFEWDTRDESPSEVHVRAADGTEQVLNGERGRHHRVEAAGLERDREYTWFARSGDAESRPRGLRLVRGIEFAERSYAFTISRDYDQRGTVRVVNHSDRPELLQLHVESQHGTLLAGFVGEGSPDKVIELGPGEYRDVLLAFAAQDAMDEHFAFPITLEGTIGAVGEVHTDLARVEVTVQMPRVEFAAELIGQDTGTLAADIEVRNAGDKVTDFAAHPDEADRQRVFVTPAMEHVELKPGERIRFQVVPVLDESFTELQCELVMKAVRVEKKLPLSFALPAGKRIFLATVDPTQVTETKDGYCTNRSRIIAGLMVPPGAQSGNPVLVPFARPLSQGSSSKDIELFARRMVGWIKTLRLNPKQEKVMRAILYEHLRCVDGEWQGDPKAALRALAEFLRASTFSELTRNERFLAENLPNSPIRDTLDGLGDLARTITSTESSLANVMADAQNRLVPRTSGEYQAAVDAFAAKAEELRKHLAFRNVNELPAQRQCLQEMLEETQNLIKQVRRSLPNMPQLEARLIDQAMKLQAQGRRADEAIRLMQDAAEKSKQYSGALADVPVAKKLATRMERAAIVAGFIARCEALSRRGGYSKVTAGLTAATQTGIYVAATSIPPVAAADLIFTFGGMGLELCGVENAMDIGLEPAIDVYVEEAKYDLEYLLTEDQGAAAAVSMRRIEDMLTRTGERLAQADLSAAEREHLEKLRSKLVKIQAAKENDP